MSIKSYLGSVKLTIILLAVNTFIVNLIMFSSMNIYSEDILYMDLLILITSSSFFLFGYSSWKNKFGELKKCIDRGENIDLSIPKQRNFYTNLIGEIVKNKNSEIYSKTIELQNTLQELNDYIIKWVHEIKIPISVCEIIAEEIEEDEKQIKNSEAVRRELDRIKFLVEQVLYTSRASSYESDLEVREVKLEGIVKSVIKKNMSLFISKNISIQMFNLSYNVMTDEKWISYILDQIINNSCKYTSKDGEISIRAEEDDKCIKLSIRDNGLGIAKKDIERIFDRGFTGSNGRKISKSTGMGLYIANKMAQKLSHKINAESVEGEYTKITVVFYKISDYFNMA